MLWKNWPHWLRGLIIGIILATIPAIFFSYILFTWHGLPFSGYKPKTVFDDPVSYIVILLLFWAFFGTFIGLAGTLIGYIYGKIKNKKVI